KTTAPAPKHRLATTAKTSTSSATTQAGQKTLPATGEATSMLSLIGFSLIGLVGAFRKKNEN
ncbi:TPA: LPXTG cell wall anchor domain-containing protein, partial [Streptococcus suis]|nr:LPXTG cell wall anchor domain-containing protein [Streptococcus suis]